MAFLSFFNRLLPFATPGTPVLQDIIHLAAICALLYYGPVIQDRLQAREEPATADTAGEAAEERVEGRDQPQEQPAEPVGTKQRADDGDDIGDAAPPDQDELPDGANDDIAEGQAGPARAPLIPDQRNVGAKKAKALARRDQRRAYHEFQRSRGEAQRARDAEGADEREKAQAAERERRRAAEAALEAKKAKEREERRAKEDAERALEQRRREQAVELVRSRLESDRRCDLFRVAREVGVDDEEWVERVINASGMIGRRKDEMTMITDVGWAVRVTAGEMQRVYERLLDEETGSEADPDDATGTRIEPARVARVLEKVIAF